MRKRVSLEQITVGTDLYGGEMLHVHRDAAAAQRVIDNSPISDGVMMSTTTYHRQATKEDVVRLQYDRDGSYIEVVEEGKEDVCR